MGTEDTGGGTPLVGWVTFTVTSTGSGSWTSSTTYETTLMNVIQHSIKAALAAFIQAEHTFSTADVVKCITEAVGPDSKIRGQVLSELRSKIANKSLESLGVDSPAGYGWLYHPAGKVPVVPTGLTPKVDQLVPKATKKPKNLQLKNSYEWLIEQGWELPEEGQPSGWNLSNFYHSFYEEKITKEEFLKRWEFSYDPSQQIAITQLFHDQFLAQVKDLVGGTTVDISDSVQTLCLDKPDIEQLAQKLTLNGITPALDKKAWVAEAGKCETVGELMGLAFTSTNG